MVLPPTGVPLRGNGREHRLYSLVIISLGFIGLYNLPLATGEWKPDDIIMLGVAYPVTYALTRSSIGLIINYVALFELPVATAVLKGLGDTAFWRSWPLGSFWARPS